MQHNKIEISVEGYQERAYLHTYLLDNSPEVDPNRKRPVIVICPGGGYAMTSDREAEPIALQFLAAGFHAVILRYSVLPSRYPVALLQLGKTVQYLREHAETLHIDSNKIIIQGFSAGGHLAASLGVFWHKPFLAKALLTTKEMCKPNGLLLCYPVITAGKKRHTGSFENLLGERLEELRDQLSLETQVSKEMPPVFLWHTATDDCVPVDNSIQFFTAANEVGVPAEMHIYPAGGHGLSLATKETSGPEGYGVQEECQSWITLALKWALTIA